jgi:hypothetical protein
MTGTKQDLDPAATGGAHVGTNPLPPRPGPFEVFRLERPAGIPVHPVADLFPMMTGGDAYELVRSIWSSGLDQPIVVDDQGAILDGRNRYAACMIAGVEPTFETFKGDDPEAFALRANIARRNLTCGQQAMVTVEAMDLLSKSGEGQTRVADVA